MAETAVHLSVETGPSGNPACSCAGLLLGPQGQLWDLYPRLGYGPRLLAERSEDGKLVAGAAESALTPPHPATPPWIEGIAGLPAHVHIALYHRGRYLAISTVQEADGRLQMGASHNPPLKDPRLYLRGSTNGQGIWLSEATGPTIATLRDEQWSHHLGGARGSYLLIAPRSQDGQALLDFANGFALPRSSGLAAPWLTPTVVGPRNRLSSLATQRAQAPLTAPA